MKIDKEIVLIALLTLLVAGIFCYVFIGPRDFRGNGWRADDRQEYGRFDGDMMYGGHMGAPVGNQFGQFDADDQMGHMMGMAVSSEREFIEGMIPHHQEAVDTAKEVLERGGTTPEIVALAENIVNAQEKEIADMKQWYQDWYGVAYQDKGTYQPMMRELAALSGAELDRTFLSDMIRHHMGALMMARSVSSHIEHPEMTALTQAILITQTAEIQEMQQMLSTLTN